MSKIPEEQKKFNSLMFYGLMLHWFTVGAIAIFIIARNPEASYMVGLMVWLCITLWLYIPDVTGDTAYEYLKGKQKINAIFGGFLSPFWFIIILVANYWEKVKTWATSEIE